MIKINYWAVIAAILTILVFTFICRAQMLRQNTAIIVDIGPVVDINDSVTPIGNFALADACEAKLLKANGADAIDISGRTWAARTDCNGFYKLSLTAADTNTKGTLTIVIQQQKMICPIPPARFDVKDGNFLDIADRVAEVNATEVAQSGKVILASNAFDYLKDPNADPNGWGKTDYAVANLYRWFNKTALDHSTNIFTIYDMNGTAFVEQPVTEANNVETIEKAQAP